MIKHFFFSTFAALTVSACAPGGGDEEEDKPSSAPFGYEFAEAHGSFGGQARYI